MIQRYALHFFAQNDDQGRLQDLDNLPRIRYGAVDLGAYEQQDSCVIISTSSQSPLFPLEIWPNPSADGTLNFYAAFAFNEAVVIQLYDTQGQVVFQGSAHTLVANRFQLSNLPAGIYILRISTAHSGFTGKWIRL